MQESGGGGMVLRRRRGTLKKDKSPSGSTPNPSRKRSLTDKQTSQEIIAEKEVKKRRSVSTNVEGTSLSGISEEEKPLRRSSRAKSAISSAVINAKAKKNAVKEDLLKVEGKPSREGSPIDAKSKKNAAKKEDVSMDEGQINTKTRECNIILKESENKVPQEGSQLNAKSKKNTEKEEDVPIEESKNFGEGDQIKTKSKKNNVMINEADSKSHLLSLSYESQTPNGVDSNDANENTIIQISISGQMNGKDLQEVPIFKEKDSIQSHLLSSCSESQNMNGVDSDALIVITPSLLGQINAKSSGKDPQEAPIIKDSTQSLCSESQTLNGEASALEADPINQSETTMEPLCCESKTPIQRETPVVNPDPLIECEVKDVVSSTTTNTTHLTPFKKDQSSTSEDSSCLDIKEAFLESEKPTILIDNEVKTDSLEEVEKPISIDDNEAITASSVEAECPSVLGENESVNNVSSGQVDEPSEICNENIEGINDSSIEVEKTIDNEAIKASVETSTLDHLSFKSFTEPFGPSVSIDNDDDKAIATASIHNETNTAASIKLEKPPTSINIDSSNEPLSTSHELDKPPSIEKASSTTSELLSSPPKHIFLESPSKSQVVYQPEHRDLVYDVSCEIEDVILKEHEESIALAAAKAAAASIEPQTVDQPLVKDDSKKGKKVTRVKRQQVKVAGTDNEQTTESEVVPVKRLLRSKNPTNSIQPKSKPTPAPLPVKVKKKSRKPAGRKAQNTKRLKKNTESKALSADIENNLGSDHSSEEPLVPLSGSKALVKKINYVDLKISEAVREEIKERLKSFEHIKENAFLCERRSNKQSRGMECDCSLSKEEVSSNKMGCGENCLNRLLKIECSKLCSLGKLCGNRKFQSLDNANVEVFKTDCKGFGVRAMSCIPGDTFIMEYVGEVLDAKQFRKRAKRYAKDDVRHFYFMALSTELCIDAGSKGNISRFINHSCSPNSETQKWMVDGEMRIGFFTKRRVSAGEEITFDYKYERYGQEAQKCLCEADNCRGWLGGEPGKDEEYEEDDEDLDEDDYWSTSEEEDGSSTELEEESIVPPQPIIIEEESACKKLEDNDEEYVLQVPQSMDVIEDDSTTMIAPKKRRRRRRSPRKIKNYEDVEDEDEIERLKSTGIRTKNHTVELSRIMVRTTDTNSRSILAQLLLDAESPCKRLFLDYYGLKILYGWMTENNWNDLIELDLKVQILDILALLGIPHKTMLVDCKVWSIVDNWAHGVLGEVFATTLEGDVSPINPTVNTDKKEASPSLKAYEDEQQTLESIDKTDTSSNQSIDDSEIIEEAPPKEKELSKTLSDQPALKEEIFETDIKPISKVNEESSLKAIKDIEDRCQTIIRKSKELLVSWECLKEVFKIPKKDRIALRAVHEREADIAASMTANGSTTTTASPQVRNTISTIIMNNACISLQPSNTPLSSSNNTVQKNYFSGRLCSRWDDRSGRLHRNRLSREERRELFALQVKTQEEEKKKRELLLEHHRNKCFYLNLPCDETPLFPHYPDFVFNPEDGNWYQMPEPYPRVNVTWGYANMANNLPPEAYREGDEPLPDRAYLYPPGVVPVSYLYGIPLTTPEDYYKQLAEQQALEEQSANNSPSTNGLQRPDNVPILTDNEEYSNPFIGDKNTTDELLQSEFKDLSDPKGQIIQPDLPPTEKVLSPVKSTCVSTTASSSEMVTIRLPNGWKAAQDMNGRVYFYNVHSKAVQWELPPLLEEKEEGGDFEEEELIVEMETLSTDSEEMEENDPTDEDSNDDDSDESDEETGASNMATPVTVVNTATTHAQPVVSVETSDLSESEKALLLPKKKTKEERIHERRQKRERDREKREYERKRRRERHGKHRRDGLVQEFFIPGRSDSEKREVMVNREAAKEKLLLRDKQLYTESTISRDKSNTTIISPEKKPAINSEASSASTSNSSVLLTSSSVDSEKEKKFKDRFLKEASKVIVKVLDPYRRSDVSCGQIKSVEDFKHLARKLTNFVMTKELKHCPKIEDLKCSESVKKKAAEFVKKYMSKFGGAYKRSPTSS